MLLSGRPTTRLPDQARLDTVEYAVEATIEYDFRPWMCCFTNDLFKDRMLSVAISRSRYGHEAACHSFGSIPLCASARTVLCSL